MSLLDAPFPPALETLPGTTGNYAKSIIVPGSPFARSTVGTVFDIPCAGFSSIECEVLGTFAGQAGVFEETLDGKNWSNIPGTRVTDAAAVLPASFGTTLSRYSVEVAGQRVRFRLAAISSGTFIMNVVGHTDRRGRAQVYATTIPDVATNWTYAALSGGITNTTGVTFKTAASAARNYVRSIQVINVAAVASDIMIRDGAAGTVLWRVKLPASMTLPFAVTFENPLRGSTSTLLEVAMGTTGTETYFNAQGYTQV